MPQLPTEVKRDEVFVALVSPMRASINENDMDTNNEVSPTMINLFLEVETVADNFFSYLQLEEKKMMKEKEDNQEGQMDVKPMLPLLKGYHRVGGHLTHPGYIHQYNMSVQAIDLAGGYLSENDLLRNMNQSNLAHLRIADLQDGYISEGGIALTNRKQKR